MKKNISVNLQGMIFHVEEDGYEMLSQYLAAVKAYFSSYEGHEEIVADIESRIAEIFFSRLNPAKQVITREDVQALIAQMGTVADFELVVEPEEAEPTASGSTHNSTPPPFTAESSEQKRLYRDVNRKVLAGVAAGIANYLQTDPLWIRLAFVFLVIGMPFSGGISGFGVLLYIVCWIALPKSEVLPEIPVRKLFRDPVDKKLGGVASGIAIYFGADVAIIRLLFLLLFFFGIGLLAYVVLWIAVPEAKSITERVQMQGNPVTLSSIEESVKNNLNMRDANGQESTLAKVLLFPVRLVSQIIQVLSKILNPFLAFLITMARVLAGLLMMVFAGVLMVSFMVVLTVGLGIINQPEFVQLGEIPASAFFNAIPSWLVWAGFFVGIIPAILLFLLGIGLLARRYLLRPTVGWSMLGIWLIAVVALISGITLTTRYFQETGEYTTEQTFPANTNTIMFNVRESSHDYGHRMNLELEGYTGNEIKIIKTFTARGLNEADAIKNARMVSYKVNQQDSTLRFDDAFTFNENAIFRDQDLNVKVLVPEGKMLQFSSGFANHFSHDVTNGEYYSEDLETNTWQIKDGRLVCLTCSVVDSTARPSGARTAAALDDDLAILKDEYSGISKIYKVREFNEVEAGGGYHLRIRYSPRHNVRVTGSEKELDKLQVRVQNGVLKVKRDNDLFKLWGNNSRPVLIEVETPDLRLVDISGAAKAEISGFAPDQFQLKQSGASEVAISISTSRLEVDLSGAAKVTMKGHADDLNVDGSGASEIIADKMQAQRAFVDLSGASSAVVNVKEHLRAEASGASSIEYVGAVQQVDMDQSGGSSINRRR
ncbi:PspC domain-containing protein [Rufibacter roseus]|uniref:PspC domain-containing protein n=1 Tax=Rufibacter roseus TaxID=1567108 RepID=A0ABW2DLX9_9BACT|nr:DUF2807 domain-containing protein [Rufibacter roseus]